MQASVPGVMDVSNETPETFALYGKDPGIAPYVVVGTLAVCFALASWGYDPQRGFGALTKRGGPA